jgi:hypothetical protein
MEQKEGGEKKFFSTLCMFEKSASANVPGIREQNVQCVCVPDYVSEITSAVLSFTDWNSRMMKAAVVGFFFVHANGALFCSSLLCRIFFFSPAFPFALSYHISRIH